MTEEAPHPGSTTELLERVHSSRAALEARIAELGDAGFEAEMANGWTLRTHMVHLAAWEASLAGILRMERRGPAMGLEPALFDGDWQVDAINDALIERHRELSEEDVRAWFARSHAETLAMLETLIDSDLQRPFNTFQPFPGAPGDAPIVQWIAGDTYEHFEEHLALFAATAVAAE